MDRESIANQFVKKKRFIPCLHQGKRMDMCVHTGI